MLRRLVWDQYKNTDQLWALITHDKITEDNKLMLLAEVADLLSEAGFAPVQQNDFGHCVSYSDPT